MTKIYRQSTHTVFQRRHNLGVCTCLPLNPFVLAVCFRPELSGNIENAGLQRYYSPGAEIVLTCKLGHTPVLGPRKIVCGTSGGWTKTKLICIRASPLL